VVERIDLYLSPRRLELDTGYQNPHFGHWCTFKATAVDVELLTDEEREALAVVRAFARERGMEVAVHFVKSLRARAGLLAKGIARTPAVVVNGVRIGGAPSMEELERALARS
jgi:hypothetical protein